MKIMVREENILNVPNALSLLRLLSFPVLLVLGFLGKEWWFAILISASLITDILDGNIARYFKLQTRFGAALDNLADIGIYIMALFGIVKFKWAEIQPHAWLLYLFFAVLIMSYIIAFYRFKKIPGLHLYSAVTSGYLQGFFFIVLFIYEFIPWLYYLAVGLGVLAYIEKILVLLRLDDIKSGVKGLYWLMRKEKE
ncbi:MAG: CDP-alcohol phosphatidyltransferase family protein [Bacteroides sp.]|nr:CDP-alcohol phosphatidyltransferase family protein [Bacteroides sp.]